MLPSILGTPPDNNTFPMNSVTHKCGQSSASDTHPIIIEPTLFQIKRIIIETMKD